jgi:hypothetical protein
MKSIFTNESCFFCGAWNIEHHHVFGGPYRKKSTLYGFVCPLCIKHHNTSPDGVHFHKENRNTLKRICQAHFEQNHGTREEFINTFGKSYAED